MNYTYILKCADNTLYTGWTNDIQKRFRQHQEGKGARYTKGRGPLTLVYLEISETKQQAMSREARIKQMTRKEKDRLIADPSWMERLKEQGVEWKCI